MHPFSTWPVSRISCLTTVCIINTKYREMHFASVKALFLGRAFIPNSLIYTHFSLYLLVTEVEDFEVVAINFSSQYSTHRSYCVLAGWDMS